MKRYFLSAGALLLLAQSAVAAPADDAAQKLAESRDAIQTLQTTGPRMSPEERTALQTKAKELLDDSIAIYESFDAGESKDVDTLVAYAEALRTARHYDLSAEVLARATEIAPTDAALWQQLGADYGKVGPATREKAFAALRKSLELDNVSENAAATYFHRGSLFHEEGLFDLAQEDYAAALERNVGHVQAQLGKAVLDVRNGNVIEAATLIDGLGVAAQPYDAWTRVKLREALYQYERLGNFFEDTPDNHASYARLLYRAARVPDAILAARHAVALSPDDYETWNLIGAMQVQIGTPANARDAYNKSLEVNPDQPQIKAMLERLPPS